MKDIAKHPRVRPSKMLLVFFGFPIISTLISLLLLNRDIFSWSGLDFFSVFWVIITCWYVVQIIIIHKILKSSGWAWQDIGYKFNIRQTLLFIGAYIVFALALLGFIEFSLANSNLNSEKLKSISNLTPKTTLNRFIFIFMALVAGLSEEFVYRGFAIKAIENYRINKWIAVFIAAIPFVFQHGLKSIDQFWWFFITGIVFGVLFIFAKRLYINIIIHWLVILSAMVAILQVIV